MGKWLKKLNMDSSQRRAVLRNMVTSLIYHERIMTTKVRAKELSRAADKMVTHAKVGTLHHRQLASSFVFEKPAVVKLFEILGPRYKYVYTYIHTHIHTQTHTQRNMEKRK